MNPSSPNNLDLRDIHLPDAVSWWPLAPGWWIIIVLILISVITWQYLRYYRKSRLLRKQSLEELQAIKYGYTYHGDTRRLLKELSILLRRVSMTRFLRQDIAKLTGEQWLSFLDLGLFEDKRYPNDAFSRHVGNLLVNEPYRSGVITAEVDVEALLQLCHDWIVGVTRVSKRKNTALQDSYTMVTKVGLS